MVTETTKSRKLPQNVYRIGYTGFILTAVVFAIMGKFADTAMFGGLALVFDPFDQNVPFPKRPLYQRIVLISHLTLTLLFFGLALIR